jgi:hypothetical protein
MLIGALAISGKNCIEDQQMFFDGSLHSAGLLKEAPPVNVHAATNVRSLLQKELIASAGVNGVVETFVLGIVRSSILAGRRGAGRFENRLEV